MLLLSWPWDVSIALTLFDGYASLGLLWHYVRRQTHTHKKIAEILSLYLFSLISYEFFKFAVKLALSAPHDRAMAKNGGELTCDVIEEPTMFCFQEELLRAS